MLVFHVFFCMLRSKCSVSTNSALESSDMDLRPYLFPDWALAADSQHNSTHSSWNLLGMKNSPCSCGLSGWKHHFSCDLFKRRLGFCVAWWECEIPYGATPLSQMWDGVKIWTQRSRPGKKTSRFCSVAILILGSPKSGSLAESKAMDPGRNWSKPTAEMNIDSGVHPSENTPHRCHAKEASCFMTRMLGMPSTCMYICMQFLIILSNSFNFILWCQAARVCVKHGRLFLTVIGAARFWPRFHWHLLFCSLVTLARLGFTNLRASLPTEIYTVALSLSLAHWEES